MTELAQANATIFGRYQILLESYMASGGIDPMLNDPRQGSEKCRAPFRVTGDEQP